MNKLRVVKSGFVRIRVFGYWSCTIIDSVLYRVDQFFDQWKKIIQNVRNCFFVISIILLELYREKIAMNCNRKFEFE